MATHLMAEHARQLRASFCPVGTTNFVHRFPFVCVSIGLAVYREPVLGVVYNPILGELFSAVKGRGALLNGEPDWSGPYIRADRQVQTSLGPLECTTNHAHLLASATYSAPQSDEPQQ